MDPRYRFTIVVSFLVMGWWAYVVLSTYLTGARGLNWARYGEGIVWVGLAAFAGFALVWAATKIVSWQRNRKTGFEADVVDEFGTMYEMSGADGQPQPFKISLSKFLPQLVAPPAWPGLVALEAELMGFLNAYRNWPLDLKNPETTLYEQAFARWQIMRHLPGTGPWHRVMALAKDLALVHAYKEIRTTYPIQEFWKRDKVRFEQRCLPHGGMAAFVLSTLPAFRALAGTQEGDAVGRALLTALRYHETPALLPLNAGPLARELVDYLWRADAQLRELDVEKLDTMTPALTAALNSNVIEQWLVVLGEVTISDKPDEQMQALKQADGTVWLRQNALLARIGPMMSPELRQLLRLWEVDGGMHHPAWAHLCPILLDAKLIANEHDGVAAVNGCFAIQAGGLAFGPVVKLTLDATKHAPVISLWQGVEGFKGAVDVVLDMGQLTAMTTAKAHEVDAKMAGLF